MYACITTHNSNNIAVSIMLELYNLIVTSHTQYTEVCLAYPFIVSTSTNGTIFYWIPAIDHLKLENDWIQDRNHKTSQISHANRYLYHQAKGTFLIHPEVSTATNYR
jgi:hypothetical protein